MRCGAVLRCAALPTPKPVSPRGSKEPTPPLPVHSTQPPLGEGGADFCKKKPGGGRPTPPPSPGSSAPPAAAPPGSGPAAPPPPAAGPPAFGGEGKADRGVLWHPEVASQYGAEMPCRDATTARRGGTDLLTYIRKCICVHMHFLAEKYGNNRNVRVI